MLTFFFQKSNMFNQFVINVVLPYHKVIVIYSAYAKYSHCFTFSHE